ncbi:hypothetical protein BLEM_1345 [Bifidobacterium lemurum]|uniref:Uncharacterized protein n=1 Tax=Bifidobacterium lemurum TaxID=1603886 RepID=A0A261FRU7_9BIFI|nr:hypothetical protein [Bifidobacterium lemurum]OZG61808.1 hypothetical protein BLEM_1345 [Bifidobacterium lemurum]
MPHTTDREWTRVTPNSQHTLTWGNDVLELGFSVRPDAPVTLAALAGRGMVPPPPMR